MRIQSYAPIERGYEITATITLQAGDLFTLDGITVEISDIGPAHRLWAEEEDDNPQVFVVYAGEDGTVEAIPLDDFLNKAIPM